MLLHFDTEKRASWMNCPWKKKPTTSNRIWNSNFRSKKEQKPFCQNMLFDKCKSSGHKKLTADGKLRTAAICAEKGFNNRK